MTVIGLKVDVDTLRGTEKGVPEIEKLLSRHRILASFFFSTGPDNMGRNLWRLLKPSFLKKMIRSDAASLYGWDIVLKGTFFPGPLIGKRCESIIRSVYEKGHDTGLHAWDHYTWQTSALSSNEHEIYNAIKKGYDELSRITGKALVCSAVPGWVADSRIISVKEKFRFIFNSDVRGTEIFYPEVNGHVLKTPQIPTTLPTYDELIGRDGITSENYNRRLLDLVKHNELNVLTVHAEVEGIHCFEMFEDFIKKAVAAGFTFAPLSDLLKENTITETSEIRLEPVPGRDGFSGVQKKRKEEKQ